MSLDLFHVFSNVCFRRWFVIIVTVIYEGSYLLRLVLRCDCRVFTPVGARNFIAGDSTTNRPISPYALTRYAFVNALFA